MPEVRSSDGKKMHMGMILGGQMITQYLTQGTIVLSLIMGGGQ